MFKIFIMQNYIMDLLRKEKKEKKENIEKKKNKTKSSS